MPKTMMDAPPCIIRARNVDFFFVTNSSYLQNIWSKKVSMLICLTKMTGLPSITRTSINQVLSHFLLVKGLIFDGNTKMDLCHQTFTTFPAITTTIPVIVTVSR